MKTDNQNIDKQTKQSPSPMEENVCHNGLVEDVTKTPFSIFDSWEDLSHGILFLESRVAGTQYHLKDDKLDNLELGQELFLVRDKDNAHDDKAVAVSWEEPYWDNAEGFDFSHILGYIPKEVNSSLSAMLDMGWSKAFEVRLTGINPTSDYNKLQISIYIRPKDCVINEEIQEQKRLLRVMNMGDGEMSDMEDELLDKGFVYYRWNSFPMEYHNLPVNGDRVVFFSHTDEDTYKLYLMKLIASDDAALPYLEDIEELYRKDDCSPFVFTNIKGPLIVNEDVFDDIIMGKASEFLGSPETFLPKKASSRLLELFQIEAFCV